MNKITIRDNSDKKIGHSLYERILAEKTVTRGKTVTKQKITSSKRKIPTTMNNTPAEYVMFVDVAIKTVELLVWLEKHFQLKEN